MKFKKHFWELHGSFEVNVSCWVKIWVESKLLRVMDEELIDKM